MRKENTIAASSSRLPPNRSPAGRLQIGRSQKEERRKRTSTHRTPGKIRVGPAKEILVVLQWHSRGIIRKLVLPEPSLSIHPNRKPSPNTWPILSKPLPRNAPEILMKQTTESILLEWEADSQEWHCGFEVASALWSKAKSGTADHQHDSCRLAIDS
jgi:hypothetical protein